MARFSARFTLLEFFNLKNLAKELMDFLFPIHGKIFFTGTYKDRNITFKGLVDAFNKAIRRLEKEPQENRRGALF